MTPCSATVACDRLNGGTGNDDLRAATVSDTFIFTGNNAGQDTILDWQDGLDTIEFNSNLVDSFADLTIAGNGTGPCDRDLRQQCHRDLQHRRPSRCPPRISRSCE